MSERDGSGGVVEGVLERAGASTTENIDEQVAVKIRWGVVEGMDVEKCLS